MNIISLIKKILNLGKPERKTMEFQDQAVAKCENATSEKDKLELVKTDGCKGKYVLRNLPFHDRFLSTPVEPMHLIKNIVEHIVKLLCSFKGKNRYEIDSDNPGLVIPAVECFHLPHTHLARRRYNLLIPGQS